MTPDNKTLADARPGGRVRLGDQAERARFEAWVSGKGIGIDRWKSGAYMSRYVQEKWEIWQAALSAQPSPGSQDVLFIEELAELRRLVPSVNQKKALDAAIAALAARQPVAASEGGFRAAASRQTASAESNATAEALIAAARQPSQQPDSVALGEATEFCIEKGDRQPVGEPVAWMTHHDEPMLFTTAAEAAAYCEDDEQPVPLFRSPAQAVDLGQFRQPVQDWLDDAQASMEEHGDYDGVFGHAIEEGTRLLALIDSAPMQTVDLAQMPDGWRLSKKATCYQLSHGNEIIGNLVGPDAEENAAIIARVLDSQAVGK